MYPLAAPQAFRFCCQHFLAITITCAGMRHLGKIVGQSARFHKVKDHCSLPTCCKSPIYSSLIKDLAQSALNTEIWLGSYEVKTYLQINGKEDYNSNLLHVFKNKKNLPFLNHLSSWILWKIYPLSLHSDLFHQHLCYQAGRDFTFLFPRNLKQVGENTPNRNTNIFHLVPFSTFFYQLTKSLNFCCK